MRRGKEAVREYFRKAEKILKEWKGDSYTFGEDILEATGKYAKNMGRRQL